MALERLLQLGKKRKVICVCLIALIILSLVPLNALAVEETVIRVGYDSNSRFIRENDGEYYGYGVEYLEKIAEYTGWEYEYIQDDSWFASLEKLRSGEIDMICTAHHTEQRMDEFLYSNIPLGYETSIIYAREESNISYRNYEAMQGKKIALLEDSYAALDFEQYAEACGLQCKVVYFKQENDMKAALQRGHIDMMVVGSRYATPELKLVDTYGVDAFYCITHPDNQELMDTVNVILPEIMFDDPTFEGNLNAKYFGHESVSSTPLYTEEEMDFVESLGTVKIKIFQDQHPSCYVEDGETRGIWVEVIRLLSEKSGIDFVLEGGDPDLYSEEAYRQYLNDGYLLMQSQNALEHMKGLGNVLTSNPIANVSIAYVRRQAAFVEDHYVSDIIAMTQDLAYLEPTLREENPDYKIEYFSTAKECFEALMNKEAGMVIQNSYRASYLLQKPEYGDKLAVVPGIDHGNEIFLLVPEDQQMMLNIVNKAIHHISDEEVSEIVKRELLMTPYPLEAEDFVYQNRAWIIAMSTLLVLGLIGYAILTNKLTRARIQKQELVRLQKKVQLDELTGLYNRSHFYEKVQELMDKEELCIISVDIANFRVVNEVYGMGAGDQLLKEIAHRLQELSDEFHMIPARFVADHFYLCVPKAEFDRLNLPKNFETFLEDIDIRVVYGVFFVEGHKGMSVNVMCDRALEAAHDKNYQYKEYIHFYSDDKQQKKQFEKEIEDDMEQALEERQFYVVVQPKYDPNTERIVGGEALVRWQHPEKGFIPPGVFVSVFERNGFITSLDYFIWEETCRLQAELKQKGIQTVPLSINISRIHFYSSELRSKLHELITTYGLSPADIELEITESVCGEESGHIVDMLRNLQSDGFRIAMDDFGSGYSSLNMLKEMPLDIIKMDLKFLSGEGKKSQVILKSLIEMAHIMDLLVVVEGVEQLSQVEFLRQFKNCYLQGYYYSRPLALSAFESMLKDENFYKEKENLL